MTFGHRKEANGGIVEQEAMGVANDFGADPQGVGLAREGESNLQSIAAAVAQNRERVEDQSLLADAGYERGKHLVVGDEFRVKCDWNQSLTVRARRHPD